MMASSKGRTSTGAEDITVGAPNGSTAGRVPAPESFVWKGRTTWHNYFFSIVGVLILLAIVGTAGAMGIAQLTFLDEYRQYAFLGLAGALVLLFLMSFFVLMQQLSQQYELSSQRLFYSKGIINKHIDEIELVIVYDVRVNQHLSQRFFNIGDVIIFSGDETHKKLVLQGVRDFVRVKDQVRDASQQVKIDRGIVFAHNIE